MGAESRYGLKFGYMDHGPRNLITDVPGVRVGHVTLHDGEVHTGVTAIIPHTGDVFHEKCLAGAHVINGFGKSIGLVQVQELGTLETPILLTNTLSVGTVSTALVEYMLERNDDIGLDTGTVNSLVMECNDARLSDIRGLHITKEHARAALAAASETFAEGDVGAGAGMVCYSLKGGIGSASRLCHLYGETYTVGALVMTNFGTLRDLKVAGDSVGERLFWQEQSELKDKGSIIVIIATDIPLSARLGGEPWSQDPDFAKITPRQILSHSSGLPDWHSRPMPMLFAPGTAYSYSGQGYYLLQHLAEKITGQSLPELFAGHAFTPFQMHRSAVLWTPGVGSAISPGFDAEGNPCRVRDCVDLTGNAPEPNAAWSLYSNAADYARFISSLLCSRGGLREDTYHQMGSVQSIADDDIAWGLGVGLIRKEPSVRWHWGDNDGFKSLALWDQQTGDGLVVTTNSDNGLSLCYDLAAELTDADFLAAMAAIIETAE